MLQQRVLRPVAAGSRHPKMLVPRAPTALLAGALWLLSFGLPRLARASDGGADDGGDGGEGGGAASGPITVQESATPDPFICGVGRVHVGGAGALAWVTLLSAAALGRTRARRSGARRASRDEASRDEAPRE
jgi:hypothetical protein